MEANVKLGHIWGIPIGLHVSWFLIFGLVTWSLARGYFPIAYPDMPVVTYWVLGALTSLLFFASVLTHELGHSFIALRNRVPVRGITLFIFGGVAHIAQEPRTPGAEFRIAIAGPLTSLGLALGCGTLGFLAQAVPYLAVPGMWLARINLLVAVFNFIPGFPLDGGRILRAVVWRLTGSFQRATRIATFTGELAAFGFMSWGVFTMVGGRFFDGLWLVFIGWFLQNAAAASYAQTNLQQSLRGVTVTQVMTRDCPLVPGHLPLQDLVEERILQGGQRCFMVSENHRLRGMLTLHDVTKVPRAQWGRITTEQVMVPWDRMIRVSPTTALLEALQIMDNANVNQVPVVEGNDIVGMLSREHLLHYLRARAELGI